MSGSTCEIDRLPEACVSHVLSFTSPRDSCRAAVASRTFRLAADSDTVWSRFLPPSYREILSRTVDSVSFSSCKELYFKLCDSVLIDGGKKVFSLEKETGTKCLTLCAKELHIPWVDDRNLWRWVYHPESRFSEVAMLREAHLLEARCYIDCSELSPNTAYKLSLICNATKEAYGLTPPPEEVPVDLRTHISKGKTCLNPTGSIIWTLIRNLHRGIPRIRSDGWMEVELEDFYNENGSEGDMSMYFKHRRVSNKKHGLIVEGVQVRP